MLTFEEGFALILELEGGWKLTNDPDDRGGMTFAGISRKHWPNWPGWRMIDEDYIAYADLVKEHVRDFYHERFWKPLPIGQINDSGMARTLLSCAVLSGVSRAVRLAQVACGVSADGIMGPRTLDALNGFDPEVWELRFCVARIARYCNLCRADRRQKKYLLGWVSRALGGLDD